MCNQSPGEGPQLKTEVFWQEEEEQEEVVVEEVQIKSNTLSAVTSLILDEI